MYKEMASEELVEITLNHQGFDVTAIVSAKEAEILLNDRLYTTVGCHPTRCLEFEENADGPERYQKKLKDVTSRGGNKVVAIGKCGLDYDRTQFCPKDTQKKYFEFQLKLCETFDSLHCRSAADDLRAILSGRSNLRGVVHSFDGTIEEARKFLELGFYIGLNGCSLKTKENLEAVASLPAERILLETDCPGFRHIEKRHHVAGAARRFEREVVTGFPG